MGRHKELECPQCHFVYTVNASEEVEQKPGNPDDDREIYLHSSLCGNCRFQTPVQALPAFKGDRILVLMFPYDLPFLPGSRPPERWDVVVFRYPEDPEVSYIKRLVGLPGETIRIYHGDIFIKPPGGDTYALARKPLWHQAAMQIAVYDDRYQPRAFAEQAPVAALGKRERGRLEGSRTRGKPVPVGVNRPVDRAALPPFGPRAATSGWPCSTTSRAGAPPAPRS